MADREMVLEGFFNMTDINFLVIDPQKNPLKEISPIDKPIDNCNFSVILFCWDLPVSLPSKNISLTVFPYIPDGFWHTRKFQFPLVRCI